MDSSFFAGWMGPPGWIGPPDWIGLLGESAMDYRTFSERDRIRPRGKDDNAAASARRGTRRAPRRICRPLRAYIPSRWDGSGRRKAAGPKRTSYKTARLLLLLSASGHQSIERAPQFFRRRGQGRAARVDHNIPLGRKLGQAQAQGLTQTAFHAIPADRVAESARDSKSEARALARSARNLQTERCKVSTRNSSPLVIRFAEVRSSQNPDALGETEASRRSVRLSRR